MLPGDPATPMREKSRAMALAALATTLTKLPEDEARVAIDLLLVHPGERPIKAPIVLDRPASETPEAIG